MDEIENKVIGYILNAETGEVGTPIHGGDRIVSKRQIEESCQKIKSGKGRRYIKVFNDTIDSMDLGLAERGFITCLLKFISYTDNILRYDNKILDVKTIAVLLDREYESTRQLTKKLIDKGILAVIKVSSPTFVQSQSNHMLKAYIFNPYIATRERKVQGYVYSIFQKFGWGVRECMMNFDDPVDISDIKDKFYSDSAKSYLYIIHDDSNNNIKIGVTKNIDRRLSELQTASAGALNMMYISPKCDNAYEIERKVHDHFSAYRKNGEWFSIAPYLVIAYIESLFDTMERLDK